ncbi:glycosyltransferase [Priestia megaterium]|uniref:glycosyltransferase n=1 Tax=Priestia megaterium TaxID=1404 RepID=UPI000470CF41|nr:glycosyltransferase [Priestia megaterium]
MKNTVVLIGRFSKTGGTGTFFKSLLEYYLSKNLNLNLFLYENQLDTEINNLLHEHPNILVKILPQYFSNYKLNMFIADFLIFAHCISIKNKKMHQVVFTEWNLILNFITLFISIDTMYFVHSLPQRRVPMFFKKLLTIFFHRKNIVTVSAHAKKQILKNWLGDWAEKKVSYIYNHSSVPLIKSQSTVGLTILTLGHVREYKNPKLWIEVAEKITNKYDDVKFIWGGDGELFNYCFERTKNNDRINFIGHVRNVEHLYSKSDIYVQLSLVESHGISVVDAMNYSLPCVVSNCGGMPESVSDKKSGYVVSVDNNDCTEVVNKIERLILDKNLRCKMGEEGFSRYREFFTKQKWIESIEEIHKL